MPILFIWFSIGVSVLLTAVDWVLGESNADVEVKKVFRGEVQVDQ